MTRLRYASRMPLTFDQVVYEALQLPAADRGLLAERIVESLDSAEADEIQRAWLAEAVRRRDDVRSGRVQPIPGEQVLAEVRRAIGG